MHYGASIKASRAFNSTPTFPRIDFRCDSLLSLCFYDLLRTPRLLTTPRPYGNRRLVLAWSELFITSFQVETLDLCDLVSHLRLANIRSRACKHCPWRAHNKGLGQFGEREAMGQPGARRLLVSPLSHKAFSWLPPYSLAAIVLQLPRITKIGQEPECEAVVVIIGVSILPNS